MTIDFSCLNISNDICEDALLVFNENIYASTNVVPTTLKYVLKINLKNIITYQKFGKTLSVTFSTVTFAI